MSDIGTYMLLVSGYSASIVSVLKYLGVDSAQPFGVSQDKHLWNLQLLKHSSNRRQAADRT